MSGFLIYRLMSISEEPLPLGLQERAHLQLLPRPTRSWLDRTQQARFSDWQTGLDQPDLRPTRAETVAKN
jgi:hypothetical protein